MFYIKIARLTIAIDNQYQDIEELCQDYRETEQSDPDITVHVTESELKNEAARSIVQYSNGYLETVCAYRNICLLLPRYQSFLLHASVIACEGHGYAFLGKSGIGKSTHTRLWKEYFSERVRVINGDKPIIRYQEKNGKPSFTAYGTPWCGKEGWQTNDSVQLVALCFLEQGKENTIRELQSKETLERFFQQCLFPFEKG